MENNNNDRKHRWQNMFSNQNSQQDCYRNSRFFSRKGKFSPNIDDELYNQKEEILNLDKQTSQNDASQSIEFKEAGNDCLKADQITEAIEWYTKSLNLVPDNPKVLCNRAQAYKKAGKFGQMFDDSQAAIENDDTNFKGYIKNGEACLELCKSPKLKDLSMCEKGLKRLTKALMLIEKMPQSDPLFKSQKLLIGQVQRLILKGNKIKWWKERQMEQMENEQIIKKINEISASSDYAAEDKDEVIAKLVQFVQSNQLKTKGLSVPEHLLCPITDDLMEEPVVITSGFTYEKTEISKHFSINGNTDPLNRKDVDPKIMITNFSIKHATEEFLNKNPWAFEFTPYDSLESIKM